MPIPTTPTRDFEVTARTRDDVAVLDLAGDIDRNADAALTAAYAAAAAGEPSRLLLDFAGVGYINSTGIAVLVGLLARARADAIPVTACGLADHYREIFTITRLSDFLTISDEAALADEPPPKAERSPRLVPAYPPAIPLE